MQQDKAYINNKHYKLDRFGGNKSMTISHFIILIGCIDKNDNETAER